MRVSDSTPNNRSMYKSTDLGRQPMSHQEALNVRISITSRVMQVQTMPSHRRQVRSKIARRQSRIQSRPHSRSLVSWVRAIAIAEWQIVDAVHDCQRLRPLSRGTRDGHLRKELAESHGSLCGFGFFQDGLSEAGEFEEPDLV